MPEEQNQTTTNDDNDENALMEEIGTLALESANLKYLTESTEAEQEKFIKYIETNADDDQLLIKLMVEFPKFETILAAEMEEIQADLKSLDDI